MGADVLSYVFAGFVALLLAMIFLNIRARRSQRRQPRHKPGHGWQPVADQTGGADTGPLWQTRGGSRRADAGGSDGPDADSGSDGGDGGGGGD